VTLEPQFGEQQPNLRTFVEIFKLESPRKRKRKKGSLKLQKWFSGEEKSKKQNLRSVSPENLAE